MFFVGPPAPFSQVLHDSGRDRSLVVDQGRALASVERTRGLAVVLKHLAVDFLFTPHFQLSYGHLWRVLLIRFILVDADGLHDAYGLFYFFAWL